MNLKIFVGIPLMGFIFAFFNIILFGLAGANFTVLYLIFMSIFTLMIFLYIRKFLDGYVLAIIMGLMLIVSMTFFATSVKTYHDTTEQINQLNQENNDISQKNDESIRNINALQDKISQVQTISGG